MIKKSVLLWLLCPSLSFGQCVEGKVIDERNGAPIGNVQVFIPNELMLVLTDSLGQFSICGLHPGLITLEISKAQFQTEIKQVMVDSGSTSITVQIATNSTWVEPVNVFANQIRLSNETPNTVTSMDSEAFSRSGALSLSDGLAKLPGISQLTTGAGISKPVIRGLYGNRIQTVQFGLRFDNQQWQDEHGMGLSAMGIDHMEVIKGAASLLYGSEAMGGVIQLIEEKPAPNQKMSMDFSTQFFTNTYGTANEFGIKKTKDKFNWRIRVRMENHADYADGNGDRVLNTRFDGYHAKASFGYRGKRWNSQTNYLFSFSNFGFLMDAATNLLIEDSRLSRSFQLPHHTVYLNILSTQQSFYLKKSVLKWTLGAQINNRQEQEGGNKISLNMLLNTYSNDLLWIRPLPRKRSLSLGTHTDFQTNENLGSRMIVPDASTFEQAVFSYFKGKKDKFAYEGGIRYSLKHLETFETGVINAGLANPGFAVKPFSRWYQSLTGAFGVNWNFVSAWCLKSNFSSGFRPGNLAELSSNGLHEGSLRYEIGSIDLKIEQNFCLDLSIIREGKHLTLGTTAFANRFLDYIYLQGTGQEYIGFQIFEFIQKNAILKGLEAELNLHPLFAPWFKINTNFSSVVGRTDDGNWLPFIPANSLKNTVQLNGKTLKKFGSPEFKFIVYHCFSQNKPGQFETSTDAYTLFDAEISTKINRKGKEYLISLSGQNLLNITYYAHLSRYKYYEIYNRGRSIVLFVKFTL